MATEQRETIAAIATPLGEGAIGIVRLSGGEAVAVADLVYRGARALCEVPTHSLVHGRIVDRKERNLDDVLVGVMRGPRTYTGEDVVEINCHGGVVVLESVFRRVLAAGARPAEPGEFTKRAFLNGRLDLAQAEAVIDVVRAKSPKGLEVAAEQLQGRLSRTVRSLRSDVVDLLAHLQVAIDYPEEGVAELETPEVIQRVKSSLAQIRTLLSGAEAGRVYRDGMRVAIVGRPNVGKSSLLNALLREQRAIVTDVAGTTRDIIEERAVLGGFPFTLTDTAGLRTTDDPVERIGVERTKAAIEGADLILVVLDAGEPLRDEDKDVVALTQEGSVPGCAIIVVNKTDLPHRLTEPEVRRVAGALAQVWVSAFTGAGLERLERTAVEQVLGATVSQSDAILVTRARHRRSLENAEHSLESALSTLESGLPMDLLSIDLQDTLESLGEITGESVSDDVIARIFAQFCVGK